ncbi:CBS domain-containing protein [Rhodovastum atsumiense]|nr:CBS domain-containing protein [Rhodovastum atsumiense]CAH2602448.1 CBS domain-containing protein [Rhodovastum atsumiense]
MTIAAILKNKPNNVVLVAPKDELRTVVQGLARQKVGVALVMEGDRMIGIISERDVMRVLAANGPAVLETAVECHMISEVRTCTPATTVDEATAMMNAGRFRHLPVIDEARLLGVISIRDLLNAKVAKQATDVNSLCGYVAGAYTRS